MFCQVGNTNPVTFAVVGPVGQEKMEGAELSTSYTQHTASPCAWAQHKFAGKWDSALKGNSALRAHVARVAGIELVHSEGQYAVRFHWDMRKFYDSIKAHLLIPQVVAGGYPLEILVLGSLTHISEMSPSWQRIRRHHHWLSTQHFGRLSPELLLGEKSVRVGPGTGVRGS